MHVSLTRSAMAVTMLAAAGTASADFANLTSSNDTYIRDGRSHAVNGTTDNMDFRFDFTSYFQFDMSALNIDTVSSATLTLHKIANVRNDTMVTGRASTFGLPNLPGNTLQFWDELADFDPGDATNGLDFRNVGNDWLVGTGAVAANLVNLDGDLGANVTETADNGTGVYTITGPDLVSFLNDRADDGGLVTFTVEATPTNGQGWGWATKENADSSLHPQLSLEFTVPEPGSLALLGLGGLAMLRRRRSA